MERETIDLWEKTEQTLLRNSLPLGTHPVSTNTVTMTRGRTFVPGLEEAPSSPAHKRDACDDYFIRTIFCV